MLTVSEITKISSVICQQFKIKLGLYSLPQILSDQSLKKDSFNRKFLKSIAHQVVIISKKKQIENIENEFIITYGTAFQRNDVEQQKVKYVFEKNEELIKIRQIIHNMDM